MGSNEQQNATFTTGSNSSSAIELSVRGFKRKMKAYTILETEFISMPMWKTILKFSDHVIVSSISFVGGLILQAIFADKLSPEAKAILYVGIIFAVIISIAAFALREKLSKGTGDIEKIIKNETVHEQDNTQRSSEGQEETPEVH